MLAKVCRFYSWSYAEVESMPSDIFYRFNDAITIIEARDMILNMQISAYPHMKDEKRKKLFSNTYKLAFPVDDNEMIKSDDFAALLGREFNR